LKNRFGGLRNKFTFATPIKPVRCDTPKVLKKFSKIDLVVWKISLPLQPQSKRLKDTPNSSSKNGYLKKEVR